MKKIAVFTLASVLVFLTWTSAFGWTGIQPPHETMFYAERYCESMVALSEKNDDLSAAAEWYVELINIRRQKIAYVRGQDGVWFMNIYVYAKRYETESRHMQKILSKLQK